MTWRLSDAESRAERLHHALGLVLHLDGDLGRRLVDLLEEHTAGVVVAVERAPGNDLVRALLGDLGVPLMPLAADLGDPVEMRVVGLRDRLDGLHEARELLELRPLVVDGRDGTVDGDRFGDRCHEDPLLGLFSSSRGGTREGVG